jgi:hypothetical protein
MARKRHGTRVVILGAGSSASCGIPLSKDILREAMCSTKSGQYNRKDIHKFLSYVYPDFEKGYRNYPNIEDFLNQIEIALKFNTKEFIDSPLWPRSRIEGVKQAVVDTIADHIWQFFVTSLPSCEALEHFIGKHVPAGNVIVTFNWDLTVERALAFRRSSTPIAYDYSPDAKSRVTLLKPHGSINWFETDALKKAGVSVREQLDSHVSQVDFPNLLISRDLIDASPVIVPPIMNKEFADRSIFQKTWTSVYDAISSARVLTILGYSLPREDQFARFVFRRALRNNVLRTQKNKSEPLEVIVVNPDEAVEGTFGRIVGREQIKYRFHRARFEDFVDSLPF